MADFNTLRFDQVRFKASHNSYERDEIPIVEQLGWNPSNTHQGGCRGLEIDIQQSSRNWAWSVSHIGGYLGDVDVQFATYLELLATWSLKHGTHDVITVTLDLKATHFGERDFPDHFDAYISRHFPEDRIFKPGALMKTGKTLADSVKGGWPTLEQLKGRFIFCLSGNETRKSFYANRYPAKRLCFADKSGDMKKLTTVGDKSRIFFNFKLSESYFRGARHEEVPTGTRTDKLEESIRRLRTHGGLVLRGYDLNSEYAWKNARKLGVNLMSTDKVRKYSWASVGKSPFTGPV